MITITKWIGAVIILQNISVPVVLLFKPVGHHRGQAFFLIDNRIRFDGKPPYLNWVMPKNGPAATARGFSKYFPLKFVDAMGNKTHSSD